jgi:hypothetical protein
MSPAQGIANGYVPTDALRIVYDAATEAQRAIDAEYQAVRFDDVSYDHVMNRWLGWRAGQIVIIGNTPAEAAHALQPCTGLDPSSLSRAGCQPVTLSTTRDELPCSIEFHRAKDGTVYWTLKQYHAPGDENAALARLQSLDATLAREYRLDLAPTS